MLAEFVKLNQGEIIRRCQVKMAARSADGTEGAEGGIPVFLGQLVIELRAGPTGSQGKNISETASQHGFDLLRRGFTASQVVHAYGDVCQSVTELASERNAAIRTDDFRVLNRCLDDAIASAITRYGSEHTKSTEEKAVGESERLWLLTRDLRDAVHTARIAFEVIASGSVGVAGSTGTLVDKSLVTAHSLIDRLLAEIFAARPTGVTKEMPVPFEDENLQQT